MIQKKNIQKNVHIHCIGIGGIGMSALAQYYLARGFSVSGSDLAESDTIKHLREQGAGVVTGIQTGGNIPNETTLVVISNAIDAANEELRAAKRRRLPVQTYAEELAKLARAYMTIAVCGAHGKSTTTALAALVLEKAGLDPTVIVGTKLYEWNGKNFRMGAGPYLVLEADEYKEAFLHYAPRIILATNVDKEHLDYYRSFENVQKAFRKFFMKVPSDGLLILNKDDEHIRVLAQDLQKRNKKILWYSSASAAAPRVAKSLKIPGKHNVANALAVLALAKHLKIPEETVLTVFKNYNGSWRRADYKGKAGRVHVYDDYAHHPTEIRATLAGFREKYPLSRIWCVFQPHQEARLELLFDDFSNAFSSADCVVFLDAYRVPGREHLKQAKSDRKRANAVRTSFDLACSIGERTRKQIFYLQHPNQLQRLLEENSFENDIVIMMGAGNINEMTKVLVG